MDKRKSRAKADPDGACHLGGEDKPEVTKRKDKASPETVSKILGRHEKNYFFAIWLSQEKDWCTGSST